MLNLALSKIIDVFYLQSQTKTQTQTFEQQLGYPSDWKSDRGGSLVVDGLDIVFSVLGMWRCILPWFCRSFYLHYA